MSVEAFIAPNLRFTLLDSTGKPAANASVYTYQNGTQIPKDTWQDPGRIAKNTNPIILDITGGANIYWDNDDLYSVFCYSQLGDLIASQDNFPSTGGSGGGSITIINTNYNLARNDQFLRWGSNKYLSNISDTPQDSYSRLGTFDIICDDWYFQRSNTNATVSVSRQQFIVGQVDVPQNPINYLNYQCTAIGAGGEALKSISQRYQSVQTFSNESISAGIYGLSTTTNSISLYLTQFFGTGGSPSAPVVTVIATGSLNNVWSQVQGTIVVPSIVGKVLGTNGNDYVELSVGLPLNAIANISLCNVQLYEQETLPNFNYVSVDDQIKKLNTCVNQAIALTSEVKLMIDNSPIPGWLLCDDKTIGSSFSNATNSGNQYINLYSIIWNNVIDDFAPIFDSTGTITTRGGSAIEDWNSDKQLNLTKILGRVLAAGGNPNILMKFFQNTGLSQQFSVNLLTQGFSGNAAYDCLNIVVPFTVTRGQAVTVSSTGALAAPLQPNTVYYAIPSTPGFLPLATTYANALNNVGIVITTVGTGIQTLHYTSITSTELQYLKTGEVVTVNSSGTLPAGLLAATNYYVINDGDGTIRLTDTQAKSLAGAGISITSAGTGINNIVPSDIFYVGDASSFYTGTAITLQTTGTLPAPFLTSTIYYAISVDQNNIRLSATRDDAINGTSIAATSTGSGISTIDIAYATSPLIGQASGEFAHNPTESEMFPHAHDIPFSVGTANAQGNVANNIFFGSASHVNSGSRGDGNAFNISQPTSYLNCFIKI